MSSHPHVLSRDVTATLIPAGSTATLSAGTQAWVTQSLGGNVTVRTDGGLFRIAREDVDALAGYRDVAPERWDDAGSPGGEFSEQRAWEALKTCYDPEIPVNIVDLGLVYDLAVEDLPGGKHAVEVKMTLTAQGCGMGPVIAEDARRKIAALPTVESAKVHVVWDPVWTPQMISPGGRRALGLE